MDEKLKKDILTILYKHTYPIRQDMIKTILIREYGHKELVENFVDVFSSRVNHIIKVLYDEKFLLSEIGVDGNGMQKTNFVSLLARGYAEFDPWYKKLWLYIRSDFRSVIVSLVTTVVIYFIMQLFSNN